LKSCLLQWNHISQRNFSACPYTQNEHWLIVPESKETSSGLQLCDFAISVVSSSNVLPAATRWARLQRSGPLCGLVLACKASDAGAFANFGFCKGLRRSSRRRLDAVKET
jgi:hypothetical protein